MAQPARTAVVAAVLTGALSMLAACAPQPAATPDAPDEEAAQLDAARGIPTPPAPLDEEPPATLDEQAPEPDDATPTPTPPAHEPEPSPTAAPEGTPAVPEVLDFTAAGVDGGQVVGAEYAGRAVALWFWAPW